MNDRNYSGICQTCGAPQPCFTHLMPTTTPHDRNDLRAQLDAIREEIYVEDCHVTGMHDPSHTTEYVCEIQRGEIADRILALFGIGTSREERKRIPRRVNREGWYAYYKSHKQYDNKATALEEWEKGGQPLPPFGMPVPVEEEEE